MINQFEKSYKKIREISFVVSLDETNSLISEAQKDKLKLTKMVLLGPPGAGKTTFVRALQNIEPSLNYISLGEITRKCLEEGGELADFIRQLYQSNLPWPDEIIMDLIRPNLISSDNGFILDGVPRKASEATLLTEEVIERDLLIGYTVNLFTSWTTSLERINSRMMSGDVRPENISHYETRLSMYWESIELITKELSKVSSFIHFDTTQSSTEQIVKSFISQL